MKFSPDGTKLATSSADGTVRIWDTTQWVEIHVLEGHQSGVNYICWSWDSRYIASCSDDKTIRLWDANKGVCLRILDEMKEYIFTLAYHPRNTILASAGDEYIYLWETHTGSLLYKIQAHNHCISSLLFSYDGSILFSSSLDGLVRLWDVKSSCCLRTVLIQDKEIPISNILLTPNSKYLLISTNDNTMYLYNILSDKCVFKYDGLINTNYCIIPSFVIDDEHKNQFIVTSGKDSSLTVFNVKRKDAIQTVSVNKDAVIAVDTLSSSRMIACGTLASTNNILIYKYAFN